MGGLVGDETKIMQIHLQTKVGVEVEAELGNEGTNEQTQDSTNKQRN